MRQRIREHEDRLNEFSRFNKIHLHTSAFEGHAKIQGTHATTVATDNLREWLNLNTATRERQISTNDFLDAYTYTREPPRIRTPTPTTGWVSQVEDRAQRYRDIYASQYHARVGIERFEDYREFYTPLYQQIAIHADNAQETPEARPPRRPMNLPEEARLRINGHPRRHRG